MALVAAATILGGCTAAPGAGAASDRSAPAGPRADAPPPDDRQPFEQVVPGSTVTLRMVPVPAGAHTLAGGSTQPIEAIWISSTEIPWDLYDVFVYRMDEPEADADAVSRPSKPYVPPDRGFGHAGYPAISMTREAAEHFCEWLSERTGRRYRLPSEAEWEYACMAGGEADLDALPEHAWHAGNADGTPHPVGLRPANPWGLHDALGNVAEWVAGEGEPLAAGGSYLDEPESLSPRSRDRQTPAWNASDPQIPKSRWWLADCAFVGFRVVCEDDPDGEENAGAPDTGD